MYTPLEDEDIELDKDHDKDADYEDLDEDYYPKPRHSMEESDFEQGIAGLAMEDDCYQVNLHKQR